jgi:hypothetical protein
VGAEQIRIVFAEDHSVELAALRVETKLWLASPPTDYPGAFVEAVGALAGDMFADCLGGPRRKDPPARWYKTYNMGEFRPIKPRTRFDLDNWLTEQGDEQGRSLWLLADDNELAAGSHVLNLSFNYPDSFYEESNAPFVRAAGPASEIEDEPERFTDQFAALADKLPVLCGHCGYSVEVARWAQGRIDTELFRAAAPYPGVTISTEAASWRLRDCRGVDQISWLTAVGAEPLAMLGGVDAVRDKLAGHPEVEVRETATGGIIVRAGERPAFGDGTRKRKRVDLPLHRAIYAALEPVVDLRLDWVTPFQIGAKNKRDRSEKWYRRFA